MGREENKKKFNFSLDFQNPLVFPSLDDDWRAEEDRRQQEEWDRQDKLDKIFRPPRYSEVTLDIIRSYGSASFEAAVLSNDPGWRRLHELRMVGRGY